jgi:hypothetical protein
MPRDAFFVLLAAGGAAMMAHVILSQVLRLLVQWRSALALELFAVPNATLGAPDWGIRLLNAKYFLPWVAAPSGLNAQPVSTRIVFWLTRLTGAAFPLLMLAFFAAAFLVAAQ